jgi:hypothetical protein
MTLVLILMSAINISLLHISIENIFSVATGQDGLSLMAMLFLAFFCAFFVNLPCIYLLLKNGKYKIIKSRYFAIIFFVNFLVPFLVLALLIFLRG